MKTAVNYPGIKLPWLMAILTAMVVILAAGSARAVCYPTQADADTAGATTVRISGSIFTGGMDPVTEAPLPPPGLGLISGATVMVQNMHHGGPFECYATVTGSTYEAFVPVDEEYVVMFTAPGHDVTSREFTVPATATADMVEDAALPPRDAVTGELPLANLLVYAFHEKYVNSEDDFPDDPAFPDVTFYVFNEDGEYLQQGVAGTQTAADMPFGAGPDINGLFYFTDLPSGELYVMALPPGVAPTLDPVTGDPALDCHVDPEVSGYFQAASEEGTQCWEVVLRPGDPGTELGGYLAWFAFIENKGQIPAPAPGPGPAAVTATVSGILLDADGTDAWEPITVADVPQVCQYDNPAVIFVSYTTGYHPQAGRMSTYAGPIPYDPTATFPANPIDDCVWPNLRMNRGYVVLWDKNNIEVKATTLADPITGEYQFNNVPAGNYKLFTVDTVNDYIWQEQQITVQPGVDLTNVDLGIPRFFGRANGYVIDDSGALTPAELNGIRVTMRLKSGSVWKSEMTRDGSAGVELYNEPVQPGYFNFDELAEVEVLGHVGVDLDTLPINYRGALDPTPICYDDPNSITVPPAQICGNYDNSYRDILWFTANYRTNLHIEPIPAGEGYIIGRVFNDHLSYDLTTGTMHGNGVLDEGEDRLLLGVTVNLIDPAVIDPITGNPTVVATTTTADFNQDLAVAQGFNIPYSPLGFVLAPTPGFDIGDILLDEWGGTFKGNRFGQFEFRGVAPGDYLVEVVLPAGFSASPPAVVPVGTVITPTTYTQSITVVDQERTSLAFGANTLVALAGEIEGGVFDDVFQDFEHQSILWMEKQGLPHTPVGIYDHLGYLLGWSSMGHPYCYSPQPPAEVGGRLCPLTEPLGQKPELERRAAPGPHIYLGNDPTLPGHNLEYVPMALNYTFGQGRFKFEADWSLLPVAFVEPVLPAPLPALPGNAPVIVGGAPQAMLNGPEMGYGVFKNAVYSSADALDIQLAGNKKDKDKKKNKKNKKNRKNRKNRKNKMKDLKGLSMSANDPMVQEFLKANPEIRNYLKKYGLTPRARQCMKAIQEQEKDANQAFILNTVSNPYVVTGVNFGEAQGHSTVSLSGQPLKVLAWSDTEITVDIPQTAVPGPMIVATTEGISNSTHIDLATINPTPEWEAYLAARTILVGAGGYATITEALANLPVERPVYIMVGPGTYNENVKITESDVKLIGSGPFESLLDGLVLANIGPMGANNTQTFNRTGGPAISIGKGGMLGGISNVAVSGFTITGGTTGENTGGGIFADYGNKNIDINNNIISLNGGEYGGGIWMHKSNHDVRIWSNLISENGNFGGYGGGISVNDEPEYGPAEPALDHSYDDALNDTPPGTYEIFNNLIYRNLSFDYGGGISMYEVKDHLKIYGNAIMDNWSDDHGGAMFFEDSGPVDVYDNVILRNFAADDGGGISFEDVGDNISVVNVYNNLIAENIADDRSENTARGGALAFEDTPQAYVYNNTITGNIVAGTVDPAGGAIDTERHGHEYDEQSQSPRWPYFSDVQVYNNIIWDNWRLKYEVPTGEDFTYKQGYNYVWTLDNIHVDNPAVNKPWETDKNSDTLLVKEFNIINGVVNNPGQPGRQNNIDADPMFVDPANFDWHLQDSSPALGMGRFTKGPRFDQDLIFRQMDCRTDIGALEHRAAPEPAKVITIPVDVLGYVEIPTPGSTELHPPAPAPATAKNK